VASAAVLSDAAAASKKDDDERLRRDADARDRRERDDSKRLLAVHPDANGDGDGDGDANTRARSAKDERQRAARLTSRGSSETSRVPLLQAEGGAVHTSKLRADNTADVVEAKESKEASAAAAPPKHSVRAVDSNPNPNSVPSAAVDVGSTTSGKSSPKDASAPAPASASAGSSKPSRVIPSPSEALARSPSRSPSAAPSTARDNARDDGQREQKREKQEEGRDGAKEAGKDASSKARRKSERRSRSPSLRHHGSSGTPGYDTVAEVHDEVRRERRKAKVRRAMLDEALTATTVDGAVAAAAASVSGNPRMTLVPAEELYGAEVLRPLSPRATSPRLQRALSPRFATRPLSPSRSRSPRAAGRSPRMVDVGEDPWGSLPAGMVAPMWGSAAQPPAVMLSPAMSRTGPSWVPVPVPVSMPMYPQQYVAAPRQKPSTAWYL
jgi:hypothetical protein